MRSGDTHIENMMRTLELLNPALAYKSLKETNRSHTSYNWLHSLSVYHDKYGSSAREIRLNYNAVSRQNSAWEAMGRNPSSHHVTKENRTWPSNPHVVEEDTAWKQSDSSIAGDSTDEVIYDTLPPRLPPKLKAPETLFVPQEIRSPEEPLLDSLPLRRASPWEYYTKAYRRELGGSVVVVCKNPATFELFAVKCIAGSEVNDKAQVLRQVRHENFLTCYEIFGLDDAIFTVSECMAISLTDLNGSAIPPNEIQIATIIHQVSFLIKSHWNLTLKK